MNKQELARQIASEMSVTITEAMRFINAFQNALTAGVKRDESVIMQGFGTFWPWQQKERYGHNPHTNKPVLIKARTSVKFKPGKFLMEILNGKDEKTV